MLATVNDKIRNSTWSFSGLQIWHTSRNSKISKPHQFKEDEFDIENNNPFALLDLVNCTSKIRHTNTIVCTPEYHKIDKVQTDTSLSFEDNLSEKTEWCDFDDELINITLTDKESENRHNYKSFSEVSEDKTADNTPNKIRQSCKPKKLPTNSQIAKLKSHHTSNSIKSHQNTTIKDDDGHKLILKSELQNSRMSHKPVIKAINNERESSLLNSRGNKYEDKSYGAKGIFKTFTKI